MSISDLHNEPLSCQESGQFSPCRYQIFIISLRRVRNEVSSLQGRYQIFTIILDTGLRHARNEVNSLHVDIRSSLSYQTPASVMLETRSVLSMSISHLHYHIRHWPPSCQECGQFSLCRYQIFTISLRQVRNEVSSLHVDIRSSLSFQTPASVKLGMRSVLSMLISDLHYQPPSCQE